MQITLKNTYTLTSNISLRKQTKSSIYLKKDYAYLVKKSVSIGMLFLSILFQVQRLNGKKYFVYFYGTGEM